jgi:hypothetical protein
MSAAAPAGPPQLHVPDEPVVAKARWLDEIRSGVPLDEVLVADGGLVEWLWARWRVLDASGFGEKSLAALVLDYRRELWLWLEGERTWAQCCSGLLGRLGRRLGV